MFGTILWNLSKRTRKQEDPLLKIHLKWKRNAVFVSRNFLVFCLVCRASVRVWSQEWRVTSCLQSINIQVMNWTLGMIQHYTPTLIYNNVYFVMINQHLSFQNDKQPIYNLYKKNEIKMLNTISSSLWKRKGWWGLIK